MKRFLIYLGLMCWLCHSAYAGFPPHSNIATCDVNKVSGAWDNFTWKWVGVNSQSNKLFFTNFWDLDTYNSAFKVSRYGDNGTNITYLNVTNFSLTSSSATWTVSYTNIPPNRQYLAEFYSWEGANTNLARTLAQGKITVVNSLYQDDDSLYPWPSAVTNLVDYLSITSAVANYARLHYSNVFSAANHFTNGIYGHGGTNLEQQIMIAMTNGAGNLAATNLLLSGRIEQNATNDYATNIIAWGGIQNVQSNLVNTSNGLQSAIDNTNAALSARLTIAETNASNKVSTNDIRDIRLPDLAQGSNWLVDAVGDFLVNTNSSAHTTGAKGMVIAGAQGGSTLHGQLMPLYLVCTNKDADLMGGGIGFGGKYTNAGTETSLGSISMWRTNAGSYGSYMSFACRDESGGFAEGVRLESATASGYYFNGLDHQSTNFDMMQMKAVDVGWNAYRDWPTSYTNIGSEGNAAIGYGLISTGRGSYAQGATNYARGRNSWAGGKYADASQDETFVWCDGTAGMKGTHGVGSFNVWGDLWIGDTNIETLVADHKSATGSAAHPGMATNLNDTAYDLLVNLKSGSTVSNATADNEPVTLAQLRAQASGSRTLWFSTNKIVNAPVTNSGYCTNSTYNAYIIAVPPAAWVTNSGIVTNFGYYNSWIDTQHVYKTFAKGVVIAEEYISENSPGSATKRVEAYQVDTNTGVWTEWGDSSGTQTVPDNATPQKLEWSIPVTDVVTNDGWWLAVRGKRMGGTGNPDIIVGVGTGFPSHISIDVPVSVITNGLVSQAELAATSTVLQAEITDLQGWSNAVAKIYDSTGKPKSWTNDWYAAYVSNAAVGDIVAVMPNTYEIFGENTVTTRQEVTLCSQVPGKRVVLKQSGTVRVWNVPLTNKAYFADIEFQYNQLFAIGGWSYNGGTCEYDRCLFTPISTPGYPTLTGAAGTTNSLTFRSCSISGTTSAGSGGEMNGYFYSSFLESQSGWTSKTFYDGRTSLAMYSITDAATYTNLYNTTNGVVSVKLGGASTIDGTTIVTNYGNGYTVTNLNTNNLNTTWTSFSELGMNTNQTATNSAIFLRVGNLETETNKVMYQDWRYVPKATMNCNTQIMTNAYIFLPTATNNVPIGALWNSNGVPTIYGG